MSCNCGTGFGNTGTPNCEVPLKEVTGLYFVQTYNSLGIKNKIAITEIIDDAYVTAKINQSDISLRWYPLNALENIGGERAESSFKTSNGGTKKFIKEGVRSFTGEIWSGGIPLLKALKAGRCVDIAVFQIDADGKFIGMNGGDGFLYPINIQKSTFDVKPMFNNGAETDFLAMSFDWDSRENDENLDYMLAATGVDLTSYNGLVDISSTYTSISLTGFTAKLTNGFGAINDRGVLEGLLIGDFALYNVSDSLSVTITSVTEATAGVYTFVIPAQGTLEQLRLTPTKTGFDFQNVVTNLVILP